MIALFLSLASPEIAFTARYYTPASSKVKSHYQVYTSGLDGSHRKQITSGTSDCQVVAFIGKSRLAWLTFSPLHAELWTSKIDGSGKRKLASTTYIELRGIVYLNRPMGHPAFQLMDEHYAEIPGKLLEIDEKTGDVKPTTMLESQFVNPFEDADLEKPTWLDSVTVPGTRLIFEQLEDACKVHFENDKGSSAKTNFEYSTWGVYERKTDVLFFQERIHESTYGTRFSIYSTDWKNRKIQHLFKEATYYDWHPDRKDFVYCSLIDFKPMPKSKKLVRMNELWYNQKKIGSGVVHFSSVSLRR